VQISSTELRHAAAAEGYDLTATLSGADILVRCLQAEDVKHLWGYPGGAVLPIYDALHRQNSIQHVLVRHEQAAVHAADGYARASGDVGVALVTSGPGATNAVTGIATAYMDSIPMVVITGQVPTFAIGMDSFQECDTIGITRPIVKHNFLVRDVRELAATIRKAFHIARTGRPGPVVVDIPKDVTTAKTAFEGAPPVSLRSYRPSTEGNDRQIQKAVELLTTADRPFIFSGGGVVLGNAAPELREVLALLDAPCTSSLMGLGAIPGDDPRFLGMPGMHGTYEANLAMQHCDVLLAIGVRFDDRVIGNTAHFASKSRKIIHIDIDPSSISKRVKVDVPIVGDARTVLRKLAAALHERDHRSDALAKTVWRDQIRVWQARRCLAYTQEPGVIKPQAVLQSLSDLTNGMDAYVTSDVGQHQMWAAQYIRFREPRRWINSGGLGTMGVGLPYAMGIKLARPQSEVFCVTGEGSIQMCIQELSTCRQYRTPVKIVSLNNGYLGMVRQQQEIGYGSRYSHSYMEALPDFVKLAEAYGHVGIRVDRPDDVEPALREAVRLTDRTVFLDIRTDPRANVWPTVLAGRGLTEMLLGSEDL